MTDELEGFSPDQDAPRTSDAAQNAGAVAAPAPGSTGSLLPPNAAASTPTGSHPVAPVTFRLDEAEAPHTSAGTDAFDADDDASLAGIASAVSPDATHADAGMTDPFGTPLPAADAADQLVDPLGDTADLDAARLAAQGADAPTPGSTADLTAAAERAAAAPAPAPASATPREQHGSHFAAPDETPTIPAATPASPEDTADLIAAAEADAAARAAAQADAAPQAASPATLDDTAADTSALAPAANADDAAHPDRPADPATADPGAEAPAHTPAPAPAADPATPAADADAGAPNPSPADPTSPEDTAEIDVEAVEAQLADQSQKDPSSTQSFAPITDDQVIDADSTYDAGTTTQLMWGARSDVGCVRSHNEDSYLVQSPLFAVCDGMGGHAAGEVASSIAVETIAKLAPSHADPALLAAAVEAANAAIIEAAVNGVGRSGMGCTATVAYIEGNTIAIAHVGDSRAYLLHEGSLIRVTHDHSYVEELVDAGEITADEARVHPNRSVITRALGSDPAMYADHFQLNIVEGDRLILCSDGLSSMIPDGEIEHIARQSKSAQICTDNLVDAALAAGGSDNVSVIVVDVVDDGKLKKVAHARRRNLIVAASVILALLAVVGVFSFMTITNSIYLGVREGRVAVYRGIPQHGSSVLTLHWLEDETTVKLKDLPEDTQSRLADGIPQASTDEAQETIAKYRKQIVEEQNKQAADAAAVKQGAQEDATTPAPAPTDQNAAQQNANQQNAAQSQAAQQGGDAQ